MLYMDTPMPPMSPITAFRQAHGYSLGEFAKASGCTRVAVQRTESGCYTTVPEGIISTILDRPTVLPDDTSLLSTDEIATAYEIFQTRTRRLTYLSNQLSVDLPELPPKPPVGALHTTLPSPIVHWRLHSGVASQLAFCKLLCLHPHTVNQVESGVQRKLPRQMLVALAEAGYDDDFIEALSKRQADYYDSK